MPNGDEKKLAQAPPDYGPIMFSVKDMVMSGVSTSVCKDCLSEPEMPCTA